MKDDEGSSDRVRIASEVGVIHGGLIIVGVYMVAPFLTAASLDLSAKVFVVAFSVAIPLLAALLLVNRRDVFRRRITRSVLIEITRAVAWSCAFTGVVAGFWHILWIAGVGILASAFVGVAVQSASYWGLRRDQADAPGRRGTQRHRVIGGLAWRSHHTRDAHLRRGLTLHQPEPGRNWARIALAVLYGGFGTLSLVIGPATWLAEGIAVRAVRTMVGDERWPGAADATA